MDHIEELQDQLVRVDTGGPPLLTVSLDLTPGSDGIPSARQVLKQMWRTVEGRFEGLERDAKRSYERDQSAVEEAWEPALQAGARGLFYAGCSAMGFRAMLETPYPLRHSAYLSTTPWLFEFARYRYVAHRPIVLAMTDWKQLRALRIQYGEVREEIETEQWDGAVTGPHQRTDTQGVGSPGAGLGGATAGRASRASAADTGGGWHAKTRIEKSVLEHKEIYAREEAARLADLLGDDDILVIAGPEEPRSELRRQLAERLQDRLIEGPEVPPNMAEREIVDDAMELAAELQFGFAEREVARWREGNLKERAVAGLEEASGAVERGQLGTLILHEDAVTHFGNAGDGRERPGRLDSRETGELLRGALGGSVTVLFTREPWMLEEHGGVLGILRWA
jgi:hypothetical protein